MEVIVKYAIYSGVTTAYPIEERIAAIKDAGFAAALEAAKRLYRLALSE